MRSPTASRAAVAGQVSLERHRAPVVGGVSRVQDDQAGGGPHAVQSVTASSPAWIQNVELRTRQAAVGEESGELNLELALGDIEPQTPVGEDRPEVREAARSPVALDQIGQRGRVGEQVPLRDAHRLTARR